MQNTSPHLWLALAALSGCGSLCADAGPSGGGALFCPALDRSTAPAPTAPLSLPQDSAEADLTVDDAAPRPWLATRDPLPAPGPDPLLGTELEGCTLFDATACVDGRQLRCDVYDPSTQAFIDEVDPTFRRALDFERRFDLFHSPDGLTVEREFRQGIDAGTPESVWGDPALFSDWEGRGDAAIWTGAALNAAMLRYLEMPTAAERERVRNQVESMIRLFEVTGADGYLARYHYLRPDDPGAGPSTEHIVRTDGIDHRHNPVTADLPWLLDSYTDTDGVEHSAEPWWFGNPSIDQYSGVLTTLPAAWAMLDDDPVLQEKIAHHVTCYLNRLQRIDIIHLEDNEEVRDALTGYLGGVIGLNLDPGDPDVSRPDHIALYVLRQLNSQSEAVYPRECAAAPQTSPVLVLDAADDAFFGELYTLILQLDSGTVERADGIDHFYAPNVRGSDAVALTHLATAAWHMTGDPVYESFVLDTLWDELDAVGVAGTLGAVQLPRWCHEFYGDHIASTPLWALLNTLDPEAKLYDEMAVVMHEEAWQKQNAELENAKFNFMYATVPAQFAPDAPFAAAVGAAVLEELGGNGGDMGDPRRNYTRAYSDVVAALPPGIEPVCPTEEELLACETPVELYGIELVGSSITNDCKGIDGECPMENGTCARTMTDQALPVELRRYADVLWQRSPYEIGELYSVSGSTQSAGLDLIEAFWLGRHAGSIDHGAGQVLAWRDLGACGI